MRYLCLKTIYSYNGIEEFFTKGKIYKKSSDKGFYFTLYLLDNVNQTCGAHKEDFAEIYTFIPKVWIKLKLFCL